MSTIEIKVDRLITLGVDAIVNPANENLVKGSGICGEIFEAAGPYELAKACRLLGGCACGNAVMTNAFMLPSKILIHAVGPVWHGGHQNEATLLSGAYRRSLEILKGNNLHSIAFPLISAGLYGYPSDKAWKIAFTSCIDFMSENPDYDFNIIFAVSDERMKLLGKEILMNVYDEHESDIVCFHNPDEKNGYLSNWYLCDFTVDYVIFSSLEQYMMYSKACLFDDKEIAEQILSTSDVDTIKALGRKVRNYDDTVWNGMRQIIVYNGLYEKYQQNPELCEKLLATGNKLLVECAIQDQIWANGLNINDAKNQDIHSWKGQNLLGFATMLVRDRIRKEQSSSV